MRNPLVKWLRLRKTLKSEVMKRVYRSKGRGRGKRI